MEDLGAIKLAALVAAALAGQIIADLGIAALERRIADITRAGGEVVGRIDDVRRLVSTDPQLLRFSGEVEALVDRGEFQPDAVIAIRRHRSGIDEADVGRLKLGASAIGLALEITLVDAVMAAHAEVKLGRTHLGREGAARAGFPPGPSEAGVVDFLAEHAGGQREAIRLGIEQRDRHAEAAVIVERVGERRALHEAGELRAGDGLKARHRVEVAELDLDRAALALIAQQDVLIVDRALGEVEFDVVAEAAGKRTLGADDRPAQAGVEAEVVEVLTARAAKLLAVGEADIAGVELQRALGLEAPAGVLVLKQRRALPRRGHLDHCGLDILELGLERFDLLGKQFDLGLSFVTGTGGGDRCIGGGIGRIGRGIGVGLGRLASGRSRGLGQRTGRGEKRSAGKQRAQDGCGGHD